MKQLKLSLLAASLAFGVIASNSYGHSRWDPNGIVKPRPHADGRFGDDLKSGPCGDLPRTSSPAVFTAGETITVQFQSTIYHQGVFRIAFSPANDQGFDNNVLVDNIPDIQGQRDRTYEITLPDTPCDACTLQLIQTMPDRFPPSNYYSCADIQLVAAEIPAPESPKQFIAMQQDSDITLNWQSSNEVVVFESEQNSTPLPQAGQEFGLGDRLDNTTVVFRGSANDLTLPGRESNRPYYYWAFAVDNNLQYSTAAATSIELTPVSQSGGGALSITIWLLAMAGLIGMKRKRVFRKRQK